MRRRDGAIWEIFLPGVHAGHIYKYFVRRRSSGERAEVRPLRLLLRGTPKQGSVVWDLGQYRWRDEDWMEARARTNLLDRPVSVYELHLES